MKRALLIFGFAIGLHAATPCPTPEDVPAGASLKDLAHRYLGNSRYAMAIALATNARTGDGFHYIANPDDLSGIPRVCVPSKAEARELNRSWTAYERAVDAARLPRMSEMDKSLLTIPADQPIQVVAWVRKDQADRMKTASGAWIDKVPAETWVTVEPHLQEFCRAYVSAGKRDDAALTRRLEQRLGLAPASSKTYFVRMQLERPGDETHQQWIYAQYYSSYGQSLISEFPWTGLGYTFDWAPGPSKASPFQRTGESEFVIHKDGPIKILEVVSTAQYCGLSH
jgi:hypothetical protein